MDGCRQLSLVPFWKDAFMTTIVTTSTPTYPTTILQDFLLSIFVVVEVDG